MSSISYPAFMYEFRNFKLESIIKDLHKMTPDELELIKKELDLILNLPTEKRIHG